MNELIVSAQNGDDKAFEQIVRYYFESIFRLANSYVGDIDIAHDITQESLWKIWKKIRHFRTNGNFKAWIFTITRNTALDHIKKKKIIPFSAFANEDDGLTFEEKLIDEDILADQRLDQILDIAEITKILKEIHPDHKNTIYMHYYEDMTLEQISIVLGKPVNTIKSWHHRALKKIREYMRNQKH